MSFRSLSLPSIQIAKQINVPGVNCLFVRWAPRHTKSMNAYILDAPLHPKYEQSKRRWESRTDPLWWTCLTSRKSGGNKSAVRNWLSNRARVAITIALKSKGYAKNGARLLKESGNSAKGDLIGSLHFLVLPAMLHTSWEDVCKQAELIVATIEEKSKRRQTQARRVEGPETLAGLQPENQKPQNHKPQDQEQLK
jgi:hypothetical protein